MCGTIAMVGSKPVVPVPISQEAAACGGWVILFTDAPGCDAIGAGFVRVTEMPTVNICPARALFALPTRLPAYHVRSPKARTWISCATWPSR